MTENYLNSQAYINIILLKMLIEELNKLLSIELDLIKDIRTHETQYLKNLKNIEKSKHHLIEKTNDKIDAEILKFKKKEIKKTKKQILQKNKICKKKIKSLKESYNKKKQELFSEFISELKKEVVNAYTKTSI
ncbi:hypothetical protein GF327_07135 [Candidatus Woesearchaeota archaeon]|nr:hypothetical protein [Candidatus Woesearchaeota archaeon]